MVGLQSYLVIFNPSIFFTIVSKRPTSVTLGFAQMVNATNLKACSHDAISCIQFLSNSSLRFQHNSPKESYDANHIVSALPALCGIITNVLAWIPLGSRHLKSRYRTEFYWYCGHCQKLVGLRILGGFKTFVKTAFAALNLI